ncbi:acetate kinase [Anaerolineales bacterium HSG25]|nr:acetate kinase [Anaerolineales bacterium HSG25]
MKILVINAGSSSIKYQLFDMQTEQALAAGLVERINEPNSRIKHRLLDGHHAGETVLDMPIENHHQGLSQVARLLMDDTVGVIRQPDEIDAVGHRAVHGGETFNQTSVIDEAVKKKMRALIPLAPLHNPANITGIEVAEQIFPKAVQVAVFDTAFHQTMPPAAYRYALPDELYQHHGIRAYGFHGTSHLYVSKVAADYLGQPANKTNLITAHLGNGCSICAVQGGQSVDTSMGLTPLAGLIMGTRSGDIDPGVLLFLQRKLNLSVDEADRLLNKKSGLQGICGLNDVRDIQNQQAEGNQSAELALEMYGYRIKKYIGAYLAVLGQVDGLIFTAGVGENSAYIRNLACRGLAPLGIELDRAKNEANSTGIREIQTESSRVKILVIPTNEELEIARQTWSTIRGGHYYE